MGGLPWRLSGKGDSGLIPGLGRSPGEGNANPLQYSCLGNPNPRDREAWQATVHGVAEIDRTERLTNNTARKGQPLQGQLDAACQARRGRRRRAATGMYDPCPSGASTKAHIHLYMLFKNCLFVFPLKRAFLGAVLIFKFFRKFQCMVKRLNLSPDVQRN